ncbi:MAG: ABC transporter ATP-binding protein [Clostridia bacterium]|nr:ABC transporter ATP-binding protein [Clostridia bacterium]
MIEVKNLTKKFGSFTAVENISFSVEDSSVYGLIGYNGAGKTTLLKCAAGIYRTNTGKVLLDGENSYDNGEIRQGLFYIPDDMHFFTNATVEAMARFYKGMYKNFDMALFEKLLKVFSLHKDAKLRGFSKGMKRQAEIIFGLASRPKFMLLDEVFDGLDPQKKEICKNLFLEYIADSECSVIISSHSLGDLANLCDHVGLINGKKLTINCCVDDIAVMNKKFRVLFSQNIPKEKLEVLPVKNLHVQGPVATFHVLGSDNLKKVQTAMHVLPVSEITPAPLTLEEVFLSEMEDESNDLQQIFS